LPARGTLEDHLVGVDLETNVDEALEPDLERVLANEVGGVPRFGRLRAPPSTVSPLPQPRGCSRSATRRSAGSPKPEFPTLCRHGEEPPESVTRACDEATVVLAATVYSLSHTQTRMRATGRGARFAGISSLTRSCLRERAPGRLREAHPIDPGGLIGR
jgi:hypothetical protein